MNVSTRSFLMQLKITVENLCQILGIKTERKAEILDSEIEEMIARRQQARKEKNFALADPDPRSADPDGHPAGGYQRGRKMEENLKTPEESCGCSR